MTHGQRVVRYMSDFGGITRLEGMKDLGVANLPEVIRQLRLSGYRIISEEQKGRNRYGEPTHWVKYTLKDES